MHIRVASEYETRCTGFIDFVEMQFAISDLSPVRDLCLAIEDNEFGFVLFDLADHFLDSLHSDPVELILTILESLAIQPSAFFRAVGGKPG